MTPSFTSSYTSQPFQNSPFIATVTTNSPSSEHIPQVKTMEIETVPVVEKEQPQITWSTPEEARQAFESLLKEMIQSPSMTWKEAVPLLTKDIRFTV